MSEERSAQHLEDTMEAYTDEASKRWQNEPARLGSVLDELLENEQQTESAAHKSKTSVIRSAMLVAVEGRRAAIAWRGKSTPLEAEIAPEVEPELLTTALRNRDGVLVEIGAGDKPLVVGVLQTRVPRKIHITADEIRLDATRELVLRAGRAALRLREDGDVELVGSRISAASRGLFRLVGRILRLN